MNLSLENLKEYMKNYKRSWVAHAYNSSYLDWENHFEASPGKRLVRPHLNQ
jgi:hypothetical protein